MTESFVATNAASSGIVLDRKSIKNLCRRSDRPGLFYVLKWIISLLASGYLIHLTQGTNWIWLSVFIYGTVLSLPAYCMSHETAHGTAFKTRWLNETLFWITSLLHFEEPLYRRYTHTNHHTYTWYLGKDSQISSYTRMTFFGWVMDGSGLSLFIFHVHTQFRLMFGRNTEMMKLVIPSDELPRIRRNAWIFFIVYVSIAVLIILGVNQLLWYLVLPLVFGLPVVTLFGMAQHVELEENSPSIVKSTRSFKTNRLVAFLYMNMHHHCEHHLYPQVPFYSLPNMHEAIKDQLPEPDPGIFKTVAEALVISIRRSLGLNTKARYLRQSPTMMENN
jgi:fatty acid desaturase